MVTWHVDRNPTDDPVPLFRYDIPQQTSLEKCPHKCPVCDGQGIVSKPPHIAGDQLTWTDNQTSHTCHACNGAGVVWG